MADGENRIVVAVRIRPSLEKERYEKVCARKADDGQTLTIVGDESTGGFMEPSVFQFDVVFDYQDDQRTVYEECAQELVDYALQGSAATIFTYGQTGSGKTYTVLGNVAADGAINENTGIFLRVFEDLFTYKTSVAKQVHMIVTLSAIELYVEEVMDLLSNKKRIKLRETPEETMLPGINTIEVRTLAEVVEQFNIANAFRSVTATRMNDVSSRSHALFFIDIFQVPVRSSPSPPQLSQMIDANGMPIASRVPGLIKSRVALVDLAGSERVKRSGVEGQGMVEAQAINKSLSTLGTVINAMYTESSHIPFRESKLTKLLKPSFVDRTSRLLLIGQVAPPQNSAQESLGTLRFCDRVKGLKAGRVALCVDPEEEERYLRTLRMHEELSAEMRILGALYYHTPLRSAYFAALNGVSVAQEREERVARLKVRASTIVAEKEAEKRREMEMQGVAERDRKVETFILAMNSRIEEYEGLAAEGKKEKKLLKKVKEEQDAVVEEQMLEAKRAKKQRLKATEGVEAMRAKVQAASENLEHLEAEENAVREELRAINAFDDDDDDNDPASASAEETSPNGKKLLANHQVVESFNANVGDLQWLHELYVERLSATAHHRIEVRRERIRSSEIMLESTLVLDIIEFMIDRAVDIAEGLADPRVPYSWYDINGISKQLKESERWYPPLRVLSAEPWEMQETEEYHNRTFLSSDESDEENHHHYYTGKNLLQRSGGFASSGGADGPAVGDWLNVGREEAHGGGPGVPSDPAQPATSSATSAHVAGDSMGPAPASPVSSPRANARPGGVPKSQHEASQTHADANAAGAGWARVAESEATVPPRRKKSGPEDDRVYLMKIYDSPSLVPDVMKFLRSGSVMMKHGRSGKPHRRVFWVSYGKGRHELLWMDPNAKNSDRSSIVLSDVSYLSLGCFSKVFRRHQILDTDPSFFYCITLGLRDGSRTVDFVADSLPDFEAWVVGLAHIVRVDPVWGDKLDVSRQEGHEKLSFFESSLCESSYILPSVYLEAKEKMQVIAGRVLRVLEKCSNDVAKAFKVTGGIHPPGINDKGAVYLTKGELRYLTNHVNLDIIRVGKMWMMFQQLNLVYDPNFVPPTAFGVTKRA